MRPIYAVEILLLIFLFSNCSYKTKDSYQKTYIIGLQPLETFDTIQLQKLKSELSIFFNVPVIILEPIDLPSRFLKFSKGERYSADSIINFLRMRSDTFSQIISLTHKDIFTTKFDKNGNVKEPNYKYKVWGIFGLGYHPGKACVISDFRINTSNTIKYDKRLLSVTIHELGHNWGLTHCPTENCIMNDANEKIATIDNSSDDYCDLCKHKLKNN